MATPAIIKITLPQTVQLYGGYGGIPEITPEMVSAALGMGRLSEKASLYCRIKYQLQTHLRSKLESKVLIYDVLEWAINENWICGTGLIPKLGKVALDEMLSGQLCKSCKGTGQLGKCSNCGGTGQKRFSQAEIARRLGIDDKHYGKVWRPRYNRTLNIYYDCDGEIKAALCKLG